MTNSERRAYPTGWATTRITYPSASARLSLVTEHLKTLADGADAAEEPWFWVDLVRSGDLEGPGVLEVAVTAPLGGVPTRWFREAVVSGCVEQAVSVERCAALDPRLFPGGRVPGTYVPLLSATSGQALHCLRRGLNESADVRWSMVRDEVATLYRALLPDAGRRRQALLKYAGWLRRTTATEGSPIRPGGRGTRALEPRSVPPYDELGVGLRQEVTDDEALSVSVARLAHTQVLRLRPGTGDPNDHEVFIVLDLAHQLNFPSSTRGWATSQAPTVFDDAARQLALVCDGVGQDHGDGFALLGNMAPSCGDHDAADPPRWSCLGDDCSPFEISLATTSVGHEVRFLVEAQADPASPASYWAAGRRLTTWLANELDLDLSWFDRILDLFGPPTSEAYWAMWHAVDLGEVPVIKVYLNPRVGERPPHAVVHDVLARLGFGAAWGVVVAAMARGATPSHLSLDLPPSRLKVYLRHDHATVRSLTEVARLASDATATDFATVCATVCEDLALLGRRAPFTTLYFVDPGTDSPARVALHLPVQTYVPEDCEASDRVLSLLRAFALDTSGYRRAQEKLSASTSLSQGLHSYVGFQRDQSGPRITTYFGARLYAERHGWLARAPATAWPSPLHNG